jgi:Flp pilus assembly protein TadG
MGRLRPTASCGDRRERGAVAVEFAMGIGLLVLPIALLVLTFPTWSARQAAATAAAQEAARLVVVAQPCGSGDGAAQQIVTEIARNRGIDPNTMKLRLSGSEQAGGRVTARVTVTMPLTRFPGIGGVGAWRWTAEHAEVVDPYRSC